MPNRREVLGLAASTSAALMLERPSTATDTAPQLRIVDTNVSLSKWPFRRLPLDQPDSLIKKLKALGISQAWAGSFDGLLHRNVSDVNDRLAEACARSNVLLAIGSVNPTVPGWEEVLRRCVEINKMPGIRLHPNYHGYALNAPSFHRLLTRATAAGVFVQIATAMEDVRTQHRLVRVPDVDLSPLTDLMPKTRGARVQILNHRLRGTLLDRLAKTPGVYFDTARIDSTDGVPSIVRSVPQGRVLFGTNSPLLIPEAALIRTHESGQLSLADLQSVLSRNADEFLKGGRS